MPVGMSSNSRLTRPWPPFPQRDRAALAAVAAREALAQHDWPVAKPLEMTVALHSSEAGIGWLGPAVYRCAQLCEVGHGGQILLSHATAALLGDQELGELSVRGVGKARVGGGKQRVYELAAARDGRADRG
jgi:class 3 adenylate cyclase